MKYVMPAFYLAVTVYGVVCLLTGSIVLGLLLLGLNTYNIVLGYKNNKHKLDAKRRGELQ
jgi:hypothetical protein